MVLSYCIAAIMAFVSAMTFVEMSVDYPLAGSSFNYVLAVMGEFPAWCAFAVARYDASSNGRDMVRRCASSLGADHGVHALARHTRPAVINTVNYVHTGSQWSSCMHACIGAAACMPEMEQLPALRACVCVCSFLQGLPGSAALAKAGLKVHSMASWDDSVHGITHRAARAGLLSLPSWWTPSWRAAWSRAPGPATWRCWCARVPPPEQHRG